MLVSFTAVSELYPSTLILLWLPQSAPMPITFETHQPSGSVPCTVVLSRLVQGTQLIHSFFEPSIRQLLLGCGVEPYELPSAGRYTLICKEIFII